MKTKKTILTIFVLSQFFLSNAQSDFGCVVESPPNPNMQQNAVSNETSFQACNNYENYFIENGHEDEFPILYVRLNLHYLSTSSAINFTNSTNSIITHTAEEFSALIIDRLNLLSTNFNQENAIIYNSSIETPISRIRFVNNSSFAPLTNQLIP